MIKKTGGKMKKLSFLMIATLVFTTSALFAQDGEVLTEETVARETSTTTESNTVLHNKIDRNLLLYATADSGNIFNFTTGENPKKLFEGNEFEMGILYTQNFCTIPWLYLNVNIATLATSEMITDSADLAGINPAQTAYKYDLPRLKGKVGLSGTFAAVNLEGLSYYALLDGVALIQTLALDDNVDYLDDIELGAPLEFGIGYTWDFNTAGNLTVGADVEMSVIPYTYAYGTADATVTRNIDLLDINVAYNIPFANFLGFTTKLAARFEGASAFADAYDGAGDSINTVISPTATTASGATVSTYAGQHLAFEQNFLASLAIRWDNTFSLTVNDFNLYATLRTEVDNLISNVKIKDDADVETSFTQDLSIELRLIFGASYLFNF